jgi:hypothetical protein
MPLAVHELGRSATVKITPMLGTGFPSASRTVAKMWVDRETVMRLGSAVTSTRTGRTPPIRMPPASVVVIGPETAVTSATPERVSEMKFTLATPSLVSPSRSTLPIVAKNWTTVPSGTGVPAASVTTAETTDTPPFAGMNGGFAKSVIVDSKGAICGTSAQPGCHSRAETAMASPAPHTTLRPEIFMATPRFAPALAPAPPGRRWPCAG